MRMRYGYDVLRRSATGVRCDGHGDVIRTLRLLAAHSPYPMSLRPCLYLVVVTHPQTYYHTTPTLTTIISLSSYKLVHTYFTFANITSALFSPPLHVAQHKYPSHIHPSSSILPFAKLAYLYPQPSPVSFCSRPWDVPNTSIPGSA